jgi:hypothetical protein
LDFGEIRAKQNRWRLKVSRKRWIYQDGHAVEVPTGYEQSSDAQFVIIGDRHYDGLQATDGADISTRAKHRAYMKANGLTTMDDYTETWKKDAQRREDVLAGKDKNRKNDMVEAVQKLQAGYKPQTRLPQPFDHNFYDE